MSYKAVVDQITADVARLDAAAAGSLLPILDAAQRELARDLNAWLSRIKGDEKFTAQKLRQALVQVKATMAEIQRMYPALYAGLLASSVSAGSLGIAHLVTEIERFSLLYAGEARRAPIHQAAILAAGRKELIPRYRTSAARYVGQVGQDIRAQLALGVVRGETMDQLVNRLVRLGGPKGVVALRGVVGEPGAVSETIAEGLFVRYRHWAERLARTEVMNAYNAHHHLGLEDLADGDEGMRKRWDASLDSRLCKICQGLHGSTVKVKENFSGGYAHPPAHPRCRCVVVAWHTDWDEASKTMGEGPEIISLPGGGVEVKIPEARKPRAVKAPDPAKELAKAEKAEARRLETARKKEEKAQAKAAERQAKEAAKQALAGARRLTPTQQEIMRVATENADKIVNERAKAGVSPPSDDTLKKLHAAPITMNFPANKEIHHPKHGTITVMESMALDGRAKALAETGTGEGSTNKRARDGWEVSNFGPSVVKQPPAQRPIYGALNAFGRPAGAADSYGGSWFVLKDEVKDRATLTNENSSITYASKLTTARRPEALSTERLGQVSKGSGYSYIEAQIHGGVNFKTDIAEIHINVVHWLDEKVQVAARKMAQESGARLFVYEKGASREIK